MAWLLAACSCRRFCSLPQDDNQPHDEHLSLQRYFLRHVHYPLPLEEAFSLDGADQSDASMREDEGVPPSRFLFQFVSAAATLEYEAIPLAAQLLDHNDNPTIAPFKEEHALLAHPLRCASQCAPPTAIFADSG